MIFAITEQKIHLLSAESLVWAFLTNPTPEPLCIRDWLLTRLSEAQIGDGDGSGDLCGPSDAQGYTLEPSGTFPLHQTGPTVAYIELLLNLYILGKMYNLYL